MKFRSWFSICSATAADATFPSSKRPPPSHPPSKSLQSDTSISSISSSGTSPFSDVQSQYSSSSSTSIHTNLSLLTLPSVSSLQKLTLSPDTAALIPSAPAVLLTRFNPSDSNRRPRAGVNFLAVQGELLYVASGNEINVYEVSTNALLDTFNIGNSSSGSVKYMAFQNGKVFTAHQDCKIRVWKLTKANDQKQHHHKLIATLPTLEDRLRRFILPQNYVNVRRHKKKLWIEHHDAVSGLATGSGEHKNSVVSISWDKSIKIWESRSHRCLESINKAHDDAINSVVISADGLIYTGSADKRIKVWKKEGGEKYEVLATLEKHKSAVNALALNAEGSVLFSGSCDRSILVWEREESADYMVVRGALRGHAKAILCLKVLGDLLLSGSGDRTVRIWRRSSGGDGRYYCLNVLDGHETPVKALAAVGEETRGDGGLKVLSGGFDGEIRVWEIKLVL